MHQLVQEPIVQLRNGFSRRVISRDPETGSEHGVIMFPRYLIEAGEKVMKTSRRKYRKQRSRVKLWLLKGYAFTQWLQDYCHRNEIYYGL